MYVDDLDAFVAENLDRYAETQGVLPERLDEFGETYRSQGHLTREQLYEIAYESSTRSAYHVRKNPEQRCRGDPKRARRRRRLLDDPPDNGTIGIQVADRVVRARRP